MSEEGYIDLKSEWQKDNCINGDCKDESKFELVKKNSRIRFCGKIECLKLALELVV